MNNAVNATTGKNPRGTSIQNNSPSISFSRSRQTHSRPFRCVRVYTEDSGQHRHAEAKLKQTHIYQSKEVCPEPDYNVCIYTYQDVDSIPTQMTSMYTPLLYPPALVSPS